MHQQFCSKTSALDFGRANDNEWLARACVEYEIYCTFQRFFCFGVGWFLCALSVLMCGSAPDVQDFVIS